MNNKENRSIPETAVSAWETFCEEIKQAGQVLLRDTTPDDEISQAEGLRYLARQIHVGFENAYEIADLEHPRLFPMVGSHKLYEGVTGDCRYHHAYFDGNITHRIRGLRGDSPLIEIGVYTGKGGFNDDSVQLAGITEANLAIEPDGSFELVLSPEEHSGNWIKTGPDSRYLMIREYAANWQGLAPGQFEMTREGGDTRPQISLQRVIEGLQGTRDWLLKVPPRWGAITDFWVPEAPNKFIPELPENDVIDIGVPKGHQFGMCYMTLESGQAMIARFKPDDVPYWSLSLVNYWWEALAFRECMDARQTLTAMTNATAEFKDDGYVEAIIADCEPRGPNWLDTRGHKQCSVLFRISRSPNPVPDIDVSFIPLEQL